MVNLEDSLKKLIEDLGAKITITKNIVIGSHTQAIEVWPSKKGGDDNRGGSDTVYETVDEYAERTFEVADQCTRMAAIKYAGVLFNSTNSLEIKNILKAVYNGKLNLLLNNVPEEIYHDGTNKNMGFTEQIRREAGFELGYSKTRIWVHEHPIQATLIGVSSVGTASSIGYMLLNYLNK